jgi:hypothetical protein
MRHAGNFALAFYGAMLIIMLVALGYQARFYLRSFSSRHWPTTTATIKRGFIGSVGRGGHAGFYEYVFAVAGAQHSGRFLIVDNIEHAKNLQDKLDGLPISIKYRPTNPQVSLLADLYDARFDGPAASQNPFWYANAREIDSILTLDLNKKIDR